MHLKSDDFADEGEQGGLQMHDPDDDSSSDEEGSYAAGGHDGRSPYSKAASAPGSRTISRKASATTRPNSTDNASAGKKKRSKAPVRKMHSSLLEALNKYKHEEEMRDIPITSGLQVLYSNHLKNALYSLQTSCTMMVGLFASWIERWRTRVRAPESASARAVWSPQMLSAYC